MGVKKSYDLIVVGAGPAGTAAAYTAAKAGLNVIQFERGEQPGSKNMFGGIYYGHALAELIPNFWDEAPIERALIEERYWMLSGKDMTNISFRSRDWADAPYNGFSIFRAKFDKWFSDKAVEAGVLLVCETVVEQLIVKDGKVIGVSTGRDEGNVYADVVIVADGVNSMLTRDIGMHSEWRGTDVGVGVKELISLPKETIEARFNLEGNEGTTIKFLGEITEGMTGGGFLYTNKDTVSLGIVVVVSDLMKSKMYPDELLEKMKQNPNIAPLIEGGHTKEYSAHLVPEGGYNRLPELIRDGVIAAGDAALLINNLRGAGANMAVTSGRLAAETVIRAKKSGDFSTAQLAYYEKLMSEAYVLQDMKQFRSWPGYLHGNPDILNWYPETANDFLKGTFTVDSRTTKERQKELLGNLKKQKSLTKMAREMYGVWRAMK